MKQQKSCDYFALKYVFGGQMIDHFWPEGYVSPIVRSSKKRRVEVPWDEGIG